jgi:predicted nucleic acid-binding protein
LDFVWIIVIVDTSVWIDFFNGQPSAQAQRLARAIEDGESIALPGLVLTEILLGLKNDSEAKRIAQLLQAFDWVQEPTQADYAAAAALYRKCRAKGVTIRSTIDCVIAQMCLRDAAPLLAKDRDFDLIAQHVALKLVSTTA